MPVFYNASKRCLIFTNLKVMYSTLSQQPALRQRSADRHVDKETYARLWARKVGLGGTAYLLVRNPYARVASFFADKFRRHPRLERDRGFEDFPGWQDCQELFFPLVDVDGSRSPEDVSRMLEDVAFEAVVRALPEVYEQDPHLRPQHRIRTVTWRGLPVRTSFDDVIPIETMDSGFMNDRLGVDVGQKRNTTSRGSYTDYLTPDTLAVINDLYREDFALFGYERHATVPNAPVLAPTAPCSVSSA